LATQTKHRTGAAALTPTKGFRKDAPSASIGYGLKKGPSRREASTMAAASGWGIYLGASKR
jgi:hypothetical protein